jgi:hypothetical protein
MPHLTPPLDLQAAGLSIEGRAVPDYVAPFHFWAGAIPLTPSLVAPASCRQPFGIKDDPRCRRDAGAN